jgi:alpha-tubulin suppressor-like RCC1 family protein
MSKIHCRASIVAASALALAAGGYGASPTSASRSASPTSSVLAWGADNSGQLGAGSTTQGSDVPVTAKLPAGAQVTAIADGRGGTLALTKAGSVLAWGFNASDLLTKVEPVRVKLPAGTKVTAVAAGEDDGLAVTSAGSVLAWGLNMYGELGDGKTASSHVPVRVKLPAGTKVTTVAAGNMHSVAVTSAGSVLAWGYNAHGELGDGKTASSDVPVRVKLPAGTKVTAVATGCGHTLALTSAGSVLAWGYNEHGQLGVGKSPLQSDVPLKVKLPAGTKVTAVATGCVHSLALTSAGSVLAWGYNAGGELGDGNTVQSDVPITVKLPAGAKATRLDSGSVGYWSLALAHGAQW